MSRPKAGKLDLIYVGELPPMPGGAAITNAQLLSALARAGCRVRAIAPMTGEHGNGGDPFALAHRECAVTRFEVPFFYIEPWFPLPANYLESERAAIQSELSAAIECRRPDVVLCGRETFAGHVLPIARRYDIPCVLRITGGQIAAISAGVYPPSAESDLADIMNGMDSVVTQAPHMKQALQSWGVSRVRVIPNLVDLCMFAPRSGSARVKNELSIPDKAVVVLHASNLKACKRPCDIVCSAEQALRVAPDLIYVIVGDGPLRAEMERACRELQVFDSFRFTGWVPYNRVPEHLDAADLVVMPSNAEQQARVYLEAQASGRTLLASDIAGAREVVENGRTGLLFRMGDIADFTRKTLVASRDPELRNHIGTQSRQAVARHEIGRIANEWMACLMETCC